MREILFRAWHPASKVMIEFNGNSFKDQFVSHHFGLLVNNEHPEGKDLLMQFTGAKDFFGTNIFEGDIVFIDSRMIVGQIVMDVFAWRIKYGNDEFEWLCDYFEDIQVIGNIHEHPALLEKK